MVQMWEIVGGADMVRDGENTKSNQLDDRLSTGALVEEVELKGDRLNYKLVTGTGPQTGWVHASGATSLTSLAFIQNQLKVGGR